MRIAKFISALTLVALLAGMGVSCATYVRVAPPPPRTEVRSPKPFPKAVWVPGHWKHRRRGWVWVPGYWVKRPRSGAVWVPGHWVKTRRGWKWVSGHWKY